MPDQEKVENRLRTGEVEGCLVRIFGVWHQDKRNEEEILGRTPPGVDEVCHERVSPKGDKFWKYVIWCLLTPSNAVRIISRRLSDQNGYSECQKAAKALATREDTNVRYIGMSRLERSKYVFPLHTLTWIPAYLAFDSVPLIFGPAVALMTLFVFSWLTLSHENRFREKHLADRVSDYAESTSHIVVIVGDDHLQGINSRLEEKGYDTNPVSLVEGLSG